MTSRSFIAAIPLLWHYKCKKISPFPKSSSAWSVLLGLHIWYHSRKDSLQQQRVCLLYAVEHILIKISHPYSPHSYSAPTHPHSAHIHLQGPRALSGYRRVPNLIVQGQRGWRSLPPNKREQGWRLMIVSAKWWGNFEAGSKWHHGKESRTH